MRLIDADKLYDTLADKLLWLMNYGDETYLSVGNDIRNTIDAQPTAYDADKVVEQLEESKQNALIMVGFEKTNGNVDDSMKSEGEVKAFKYAVEIVKGGGSNE